MRTVILGFACALAAAGCSRDSTPADAISTTDSAGVQIVRVTATAPDTAAVEQVLDIGSVDGEAEYQLHRVNELTRLSDGTIVVANGGTELRYYAPDGTYLRTAGREGEGPGEFRGISYLRRLRGDSLLVYDARSQRVTIIAPDGSIARDYTPPAGDEGFPLQVAAALEDGTLLLRQRASVPERSTDLRRDTLTFLIPDSSGLRRAGVYPGAEMQLRIDGMGSEIMSISIAQLPFSRDVYTAATADEFIVAANETYDVHAFDAEGVLRRALRRDDIAPQAVDDAMLTAYLDVRIAELEEMRSEQEEVAMPDAGTVRRETESLPRIPTAPVHGGILAADDGTLWVRHYAMSDRGPTRWDVYAPDGSIRHTVTLPDRFTPMAVHEDVVYGVQRDELDVEHVVAYRVR